MAQIPDDDIEQEVRSREDRFERLTTQKGFETMQNCTIQQAWETCQSSPAYMIQEKKDGVSCLAIVSFLHQADFEKDPNQTLMAPFLIESSRNWTMIQINGITRGYLCLHIFFPHNLANRQIPIMHKKEKRRQMHVIPNECARLSQETYDALQASIVETWNMELILEYLNLQSHPEDPSRQNKKAKLGHIVCRCEAIVAGCNASVVTSQVVNPAANAGKQSAKQRILKNGQPSAVSGFHAYGVDPQPNDCTRSLQLAMLRWLRKEDCKQWLISYLSSAMFPNKSELFNDKSHIIISPYDWVTCTDARIMQVLVQYTGHHQKDLETLQHKYLQLRSTNSVMFDMLMLSICTSPPDYDSKKATIKPLDMVLEVKSGAVNLVWNRLHGHNCPLFQEQRCYVPTIHIAYFENTIARSNIKSTFEQNMLSIKLLSVWHFVNQASHEGAIASIASKNERHENQIQFWKIKFPYFNFYSAIIGQHVHKIDKTAKVQACVPQWHTKFCEWIQTNGTKNNQLSWPHTHYPPGFKVQAGNNQHHSINYGFAAISIEGNISSMSHAVFTKDNAKKLVWGLPADEVASYANLEKHTCIAFAGVCLNGTIAPKTPFAWLNQMTQNVIQARALENQLLCLGFRNDQNYFKKACEDFRAKVTNQAAHSNVDVLCFTSQYNQKVIYTNFVSCLLKWHVYHLIKHDNTLPRNPTFDLLADFWYDGSKKFKQCIISMWMKKMDDKLCANKLQTQQQAQQMFLAQRHQFIYHPLFIALEDAYDEIVLAAMPSMTSICDARLYQSDVKLLDEFKTKVMEKVKESWRVCLSAPARDKKLQNVLEETQTNNRFIMNLLMTRYLTYLQMDLHEHIQTKTSSQKRIMLTDYAEVIDRHEAELQETVKPEEIITRWRNWLRTLPSRYDCPHNKNLVAQFLHFHDESLNLYTHWTTDVPFQMEFVTLGIPASTFGVSDLIYKRWQYSTDNLQLTFSGPLVFDRSMTRFIYNKQEQILTEHASSSEQQEKFYKTMNNFMRSYFDVFPLRYAEHSSPTIPWASNEVFDHDDAEKQILKKKRGLKLFYNFLSTLLEHYAYIEHHQEPHAGHDVAAGGQQKKPRMNQHFASSHEINDDDVFTLHGDLDECVIQ